MFAVAFVFFYGLGFPAWAGDDLRVGPVLHLEDCVVRGIAVSHRIAERKQVVEQSKKEVIIARSRMLPRVTAQIEKSKIENTFASGPADSDYQDQTINSASVRLTQVLFSGLSLLQGYKKAKVVHELRKAETHLETMNVVLDIQTAFLRYLKAKEEKNRLEHSVERLQKNVAMAEDFFRERLVSQAELLQARVDLEEAKQELERATASVLTSLGTLNSLLDFPPYAKVKYVGRLLSFPVDIPISLEECLWFGLTRRPEIVVLEKNIEAAEKDVKIAFGETLPRVEASVSYVEYGRDYKEPGYFYGYPYDRDQTNHYWNASIRLFWSFGLGGEEFYRVNSARIEVMRLRERLAEVKRSVQVEIGNQYRWVEEARRRIGMSQKTVELAQKAYMQAEERFRLGVGSLMDLLDAQARLTRAEASRNQAYLDFQLSLARLYHAMGLRNDSLIPSKARNLLILAERNKGG
ncbi:MAG: TolC family protein [Deltaproteobacteria bacterium]|nr:TolC family protein [Deltaproteobacteria bacterium]MBW2069276.1 TolC family protein [Deltaproteobacteria bacterium]